MKSMRWSLLLLFILLLLDQGAKNLINSTIPAGTILSYGTSMRLVLGNSHHYAAPEYPILLAGSFVAALVILVASYGYYEPSKDNKICRILFFSAVCIFFEVITQSIDHAVHGYVINYVGFYVQPFVDFGEIAHIGDYVFRAGMAWAGVGGLLITNCELFGRVRIAQAQPS